MNESQGLRLQILDVVGPRSKASIEVKDKKFPDEARGDSNYHHSGSGLAAGAPEQNSRCLVSFPPHHAHTHTHTLTGIHTHAHTYTHTRVSLTHTHTQALAHTHSCTCSHTCLHTHTPSLWLPVRVTAGAFCSNPPLLMEHPHSQTLLPLHPIPKTSPGSQGQSRQDPGTAVGRFSLNQIQFLCSLLPSTPPLLCVFLHDNQ